MKTQSLFLVGYANQTSLNSISPLKLSLSNLTLSLAVSSISGICSIILNILSPETVDLAISGPNYCAIPEAEVALKMAKIAMNTSAEFKSGYIFWNSAPE